jgi:hypothetical protein
MPIAGLLAACLIALPQQQPPAPDSPAVIQNTGAPIKVPFSCTEEDIADAGMTCTAEEPCPVYLEIVSIESSGNQIIAAGNLHSSSATLYSLLLTSSDGGKTWREPIERTRGAGLEQIRFYGFENGWISGQLLMPLPRDPFLLITRDSGKTWTRKPIFDDGRAGTILQFWFDSAKDGGMIIDRGQSSDGARYELYETPNGGDSWMVREASEKPMQRRRPPSSGVASIRARADEKTKTYRLERNEGGKWNQIAAFLLPVDPCAPKEHQLAPPPEPTDDSGPLVVPSDPAKRKKPPTLKK